jgi:mercuric ion binding protein
MRLFAKIMVIAMLPIAAAFAEAFQTAVIDLQKIQCYGCINTVQKALEKVPGVERTKMDLDNKTATVKFDPSKTNADALVQATAKAGFPATVRR